MNKYLIFLLFTYLSFFCSAQDVRITNFRTSNELKDSSYKIENKTITLDYRKSHVLIAFEDPASEEQVNYEIQLQGFDKKWQKIGIQSYANYINLFGGKYEFKVRNTKYPSKVASVKFEIEAAFWQQSWFVPSIITYLLLIAGLIFYFFNTARLKEQIRLQNIRNDISADLHDDVGSMLSNISFLTDIARSRLQSKPQDLPMLLDKISTDSKEMIYTMRGMIWSISPNNDLAMDFFEKVHNYLKETLSPYEISMKFNLLIPDKQKLNVEIQRNLFLIFKESTNNVLKYAKAKKLSVTIKKQSDWLMIQIKDDGIGFELGPDSEGNGLRNMKNRIEHLGGNIEIESNAGVRLRMLIPLT